MSKFSLSVIAVLMFPLFFAVADEKKEAEPAATEAVTEPAAATDSATAPVASEIKIPVSDIDRASFQIGMQIGKDLKKSNLLMINVEQLSAGISAAMADKQSPLTDEQIRAAFAALQKEVRQIAGSMAARNKAAGEAFLEENKSKPNVQVTASGLQYEVLVEGTGATPTAASTVSTHYRGRLISGKVFDESYKGPEPTTGDEPATFAVNGVIPGWTEALQLMKVGAKYRLFIPGSLAYGENGAGEDIGPNATLIFEVQLVDIKE